MISEYGFNPLGKKAPAETKLKKKDTKDPKDESYSPVKDSQKEKPKKQSTSPYKRGRDPYEEDQQEYYENLNKMNTDLAHLNDTHYDKKTMHARKKAKGHHMEDPEDRLEQLKDQNTLLKTKQRELEQQVKLISTKLARQINVINSERFAGKNKITAAFERNLDELICENTELQQQEQDMMEKVKKLLAKRKKELDQGKHLYSVATQGGAHGSHNDDKRVRKHEQEQQHIIQALKQALEKSHKELVSLAKQQEDFKRMQGSDVNIEALQKQKMELEHKIIQSRSRLEDVKANLKVRDEIFNSGKSYEASLFEQLRIAQQERTQLEAEKRMLQTAAATNTEILERITATKKERDRLQNEFETVMRKPFFKKERDENSLKELDKLQAQIEEKRNQIDDDKRLIIKNEKEIDTLDTESGKLQEEIAFFKDQTQKMKMHLDPTSLTIGDIMTKLKKEDVARFRQAMEDLEYEGKDPNWQSLGIMDQLNQIKGFEQSKGDDTRALNQVREKLRREKEQLVMELTQTQGLLQTTVGLDKQQAQLSQTTLTQLQDRIKSYYAQSTDLSNKIKTQNRKLIDLQERCIPSNLTAAGLAQFNSDLAALKREVKDDDAMTEFSTMTDETEIGPIENLLDLRITQASIDRVSLAKLFSGKDNLPANLKTFLAVDFYNHDTKTTDLADGDDPRFDTLFSFKNTVDDFYLSHLEKDTILVDVFLRNQEKANKTIKIGSARLPLGKLLEKDYSFQVQSIQHEDGSGHQLQIGRLFYRMRMRKDLNEALKWHGQKQNVSAVRDPTIKQKASNREKIVEIIVNQARNLRIAGTSSVGRRPQPFFSYRFYTFDDIISNMMTGENPAFDHRKQFKCDETTQFIQYMKKDTLKIDFIDESVDMTQTNLRDYIGSVRIPLAAVLANQKYEGILKVTDEMNRAAGEVEVSVKIYDPVDFELKEQREMNLLQVTNSKQIQQDVISRIVFKFAETGSNDLNVFLDMLFAKNLYDNRKVQPGNVLTVTKQQFKEFLIQDMKVPGLNDQELSIFLKTHPVLNKLELFTREDLQVVLEQPFKRACDELFNIEANSTRRYGTQDLRNAAHMTNLKVPSTAFGLNQSPTKAQSAHWLTNKEEHKVRPGGDDDFNDRALDQTIGRDRTSILRSPTRMNDAKLSRTVTKGQVFDQLEEAIKSKVYEVIKEYQLEVGSALVNVAEPHHSRAVLRKLIPKLTDEQCNQFHRDLSGGRDQLFYKEALIERYSSKQNIPIKQVDSVTNAKLAVIRKKIYQYLLKKNYNLEDLFTIIDKDNSKYLTITEWTTATKAIMTEDEALTFFRACDPTNTNNVHLDSFIRELIAIRVAKALTELETAMNTINQSASLDAAAKFFQLADKDKNGTIDVIEFGDVLESAWKKVSKEELDNIFRAIERKGTGEMNEEQLRYSFANKEQSLVNQEAFINIKKDLLLPIFTKVMRRYKRTSQDLWKQFGIEGKFGLNQMQAMFEYELNIKLTPDEINLMKQFLVEASSKGSLNETAFRELWNEKNFQQTTRPPLNEQTVRQALLKLATDLQRDGKQFKSEIASFQNFFEKENEEITRRNFKYFLNVKASCTPFELECCCSYFDGSYEGFIKIADVVKKYPSDFEIKEYREAQKK